MSDRMTAVIEFPTFALELASIQTAVQEEGWDEQESYPDGTTWLTVHEAAWGELPTLEDALMNAGIAFDRRSDAKYEYDAEVRYFRPASDTTPPLDHTVSTLNDHVPVISLTDLEDLGRGRRLSVRAIRAHLGLPRDTVAQWARRHRRQFRRPIPAPKTAQTAS